MTPSDHGSEVSDTILIVKDRQIGAQGTDGIEQKSKDTPGSIFGNDSVSNSFDIRFDITSSAGLRDGIDNPATSRESVTISRTTADNPNVASMPQNNMSATLSGHLGQLLVNIESPRDFILRSFTAGHVPVCITKCARGVTSKPLQTNSSVSYNNVVYFDVEICVNCHTRLVSTNSAPFPPTSISSLRVTGTSNDVAPKLRRSRRDPDKIWECETPDLVAITIQHCTTETAGILENSSSGSSIYDEDELPVEAHYEIGDIVHLLPLQNIRPDPKSTFKIRGRYFECTDDAEDEQRGDIEQETMDEDRDNSLQQIRIGGLKSGWYYKLDGHLQTRIGIKPDLVMWHEDNLELALDDDSGDDEDEGFDCAEAVRANNYPKDYTENESDLVSDERSVNGNGIKGSNQMAESLTATTLTSEQLQSPTPLVLETSRPFHGLNGAWQPSTTPSSSFNRQAPKQPSPSAGFEPYNGQPK